MINVCLFNEDNIDELQEKINYFLKYLDEINLIDIKYQTNFYIGQNNQYVYSYSALIIYRVMVK